MDPQTSVPVNYISAFIGGLVVGFSPCVYPLIPITLSFIGVEGQSSRVKGLLLSLIYVLGIAVTYSILGVIAALTGTLFGNIAATPWPSLLVGVACIIAGLAFLNVFHFHFSAFALHHKIKRTEGFLSAFLLGLVSGLIAGPCTAPVLGTILVYVAGKQNVVYGASLLFIFAYGMGTLLILTGVFGAAFFHLARSAVWQQRIKKISGYVLIMIGVYFFVQAGRVM